MDVDLDTFNIDDIPVLVKWLEELQWEGWGFEAEYMKLLTKSLRGYTARKDRSMIGCIFSTRLTPDSYYISVFIVDSKHRGTGVGRLLWQHMTSTLPQDSTLSLDCFEHMRPMYMSKFGFNVRSGTSTFMYHFNVNSLMEHLEELTSSENLQVVKCRKADVKEFLIYVTDVVATNNDEFWRNRVNYNGLCVFVARDESNQIAGTITLSVISKTEMKICSLYANSLLVAFTLLKSTVKEFVGERYGQVDKLKAFMYVRSVCDINFIALMNQCGELKNELIHLCTGSSNHDSPQGAKHFASTGAVSQFI